jgi:glycosyltransferase involved in cell wall biosynthesis
MSERTVTDITIIIPSLNPDEKLIRTIDGIISKGFHRIVVVDDGSDKEHKQPFVYAAEKGCKVLVHEVNKGKGRALKTAFEYCMTCPDCIGVITVDGDGQHGPDDIYNCGKELLLQNNQRVILGCRDFSAENVPFKSKYGNNITKFAFRFLCGIKISDTQTGLRAIPAEFLQAMTEYKGERFEYETNMLLEMKSQGIPFSEVKIETIYLDDNASTHFHPWRDSVKIYKIIFKYSLSAGASAVIDLILFYLALHGLELFGFSTPENTELTVLLATVFARVLSSLFNYSVNRKVVFCSASRNSFVKYYVLCVAQMLLSAALVALLSSLCMAGKFGKLLVKLVVDTCLFFVSFGIQREWVFKKKQN